MPSVSRQLPTAIQSSDHMGWVSYLEDMTERFHEDLNTLRGNLDSPPARGWDPKAEFGLWLERADLAIKRLTHVIELATDPSVELAGEVTTLRSHNESLKFQLELHEADIANVRSLREKNAQLLAALESQAPTVERFSPLQAAHNNLQEQLREFQTTTDKLQSRVTHLESENSRLTNSVSKAKLDNKVLKKDYAALSNRLEALFSKNPLLVYETYSKDEDLRRSRPHRL